MRELILSAQEGMARMFNAGLTLLYWEVGERIRFDVLKGQRAGYGEEIVQTLSAQLGWSHFKEIVPMEDGLKRDFYAEMCRMENWSVRTLREKIRTMLYERTAISKKPDKLIKQELAALRQQDRLTGISRRRIKGRWSCI